MAEPRRNIRSARSVEAILDAAAACFAEKGIAASSIDEIARRARVSRATVYYNFESKDEIAVRIAERFRVEGYARYLRDRDLNLPAATLIERFFGFAQQWVDAHREVAQLATLAAVRGIGRNPDRPPTREVLLELVREGQRQGSIPRGADPVVLAGVLSGILFQAPLIGAPAAYVGPRPWILAMVDQVLGLRPPHA